MVGWHQQLNGHEFEQALGFSGGQGGLVCCDSWGCKESDTTERLNNKNMCLCLVSKPVNGQITYIAGLSEMGRKKNK